MFKFILLGSLFIVGSNGYSTRIIGGKKAYLREFPTIVSLQYNNKHACGGSILDETHILTAAHCYKPERSDAYYIVYGTVDTENHQNMIKVASGLIHPKYNVVDSHNDIAILTLEAPIIFSKNVQPAMLPKARAPTPERMPAIVAGWGITHKHGSQSPQFLKKVFLGIFPERYCMHGSKLKNYMDPKVEFCAGSAHENKAECSGDSGGPLLLTNGTQVGVVSWSLKPCTSYPGVYVKLSMFVDWINENIQSKITDE